MTAGKDTEAEPHADGARGIDAVLRLASDPPLAQGAAERLMARIAQEPQEARVVALPLRGRSRPGLFRYAAALPLAASLALGIYLGAMGTLDFMMPSAITGNVALNDDVADDLGGVGEAEAYAEESQS